MSELLTSILDKVQKIPPIKSDTYRIIQILSKDNYSINEIAKIVETDVSLTARCLQTVNSASIGLRQKVISIRHALNLLGSKNFLSIVLRESVLDITPVSMKGYYTKTEDFWNDCLRSAIAARILVTKSQLNIKPDLAYTAALLQDIGKIVIDEFFDRVDLDSENFVAPENKKDFLDVEKTVLGTDHTIIGEQIAESWQFPDPLKSVIRFHHTPSLAPKKYRDLVVVVHLGNFLATFTDTIGGVGSFEYRIDPIIEEYFNIDKKIVAELICSIDLEFISTIRNFGWY